MYGPQESLKDMARSHPSSFPAKNARRSTLTAIANRKKVSIGWLMWQVAQEEITPRDAGWAMCPHTINPMTSGFIKLIGHSTLVFDRWRSFFRECGGDPGHESAVRSELMKIWGLKEDKACHQLRERP